MSTAPAAQLGVLTEVVRRFGLSALEPTLTACETLAGDDTPLDVAVLGQFKSGKSSLLNAILGEKLFPVGVIPVTAVITRVAAGAAHHARVTHLDGTVEEVEQARIVDFATEAGNPRNRRQVAAVDVLTPALADLPGVRLVDTPGLGSVLAHNTEATRTWMPQVAVALVTVSAERPLSDEDRRLIAEARRIASRVIVVLTKVDLLSAAELGEVAAFLDQGLREGAETTVPVLPFSCRVERERYVSRLREVVLLPVAGNVAGERRAALERKLATLVRSCREYLMLGLHAAERADTEREKLRAALRNESIKAAVIQDELRQAERAMSETTRPAFEDLCLSRRAALEHRLSEALTRELPSWRGNLAEQTARYESWMAEQLRGELMPISQEASPRAAELLGRAEERFRRVVEAFRDRLGRDVRESTGLTISPLRWEAELSRVTVVPVAVSRAFMTNWELLWWLLPMRLVGGLFRRHVLGLVSWEVLKNLTRLAGDWAAALDRAVGDLRGQAEAWVEKERTTLDRLVGQCPAEAADFRAALRRLDEIAAP